MVAGGRGAGRGRPVVPAGTYGASTALLLAAAWIWPVLIWSGGAKRGKRARHPARRDPGGSRQLAAEWLAGLALTAATVLGPQLRMAAASEGPRVAAWVGGALFIPSLALLLGSVSRSHRLFQALYMVLWYAAVNQLAAADYMGTVLVHGRPPARLRCSWRPPPSPCSLSRLASARSGTPPGRFA